jgi:calcineurin-like phosphoesterase
VQTNDDAILPKGTAILSDVGMNGSINWVIWADYESVKKRFITGISKWLISQNLDSNYVVSWVVFDIDETGKCSSVEKIRINSKL